MLSPVNTVFSIFSLLGFLLCMVPLPWHFQAWNVGTCAFMLWVGAGCLHYFINAIVWSGNGDNVAPVWCDISTRLVIALNIAIPLCSLCINRRLCNIATVKKVNWIAQDRRREVLGDIFICLGIPALYSALAIVYQGNRFNIYEDYGCAPALYSSWVTLVLYNVPPILIGLISGVYCTRSIIAFKKQQDSFNALLRNHHQGLNTTSYFRLMAIALFDVLLTVPICAWVLFLNASGPLFPYIDWDYVHYDFWHVFVYSTDVWQGLPGSHILFELTRWLLPFTAIVFFALFGFTRQARENYRSALSSVVSVKWTGSRSGNSSCGIANTISSFSAGGSLLPMWRKRKPSHVSFDDVSMSGSPPPQRPISLAVSFRDVGGILNSSK